jgi:hypothetical protein
MICVTVGQFYEKCFMQVGGLELNSNGQIGVTISANLPLLALADSSKWLLIQVDWML